MKKAIFLLLLIFLSGCSHNELMSPASVEREIEDPDYVALREVYDSVNFESLSREEEEWLRELNKDDLSKALKQELEDDELNLLERMVNIENISDKDAIFLYRVLKPAYEGLKAFHMQNLD